MRRNPQILAWLWIIGFTLSTELHSEDELHYIAIIDHFYPPVQGFESDEQKEEHRWLYGVLDIDDDHRKEGYYHGDIVQMIAADPKFIFLRYPLSGQKSPMEEIHLSLTSIIDRLDFTHLDSLILSWESSTLISQFEEPLVRTRREHYVEMVRQWGEQYPGWAMTYKVIQDLEKLTERGVDVYTISGNSGPRSINTLSLAKGVTTVGAAESELGYFISDNVFVDRYEQAFYQLKRVDNSNGEATGYDLDGDGCEDIPISALTTAGKSDLPAKLWPPIKGSSFAAPMALKKKLSKGSSKGEHCRGDTVATALR